MADRLAKFFTDNDGNSTVKTALLFGAVAVAISVLAAPALQNATKLYAENRAFGIDQVMTGSVKKPKRYIVRKSVLSGDAERVPAQ